MIFLCICRLYEWIIDRENFTQILWPGITTIIGIIASVIIARCIFKQEQKKENENQEKLNKQIVEIIINSLNLEVKNLKDSIKLLDDLENITPNNIIGAFKLIFDATFLDSILNIDIISINKSFDDLKNKPPELNSVKFYTTLISVKNLYNHFSMEQEKFDNSIRPLFIELDNDVINLHAAVFNPENNLQLEMSNKLQQVLSEYYIRIYSNELNNKKNEFSKDSKTNFESNFHLAERIIRILDIECNNHLISTPLYNYSKIIVFKSFIILDVFNKFSNNIKTNNNELKLNLKYLDNYLKVLKETI